MPTPAEDLAVVLAPRTEAHGEVVDANGPAAAAVLAAGIGCTVLGLATVLAEASEGIRDALNWWHPAGPLAGKTGVGAIAWLISWAVLHMLWRSREVHFGRVWTVAAILVGLGFLMTFPPFFGLFSR